MSSSRSRSPSPSLIYQVVWLRLAMAAFGVTTPSISLVLSVFMAGLALGSWAGGWLAVRLSERGSAAFFLRLYAAAELIIGAGGVLVPAALSWGRDLLLDGRGVAWSAGAYYLVSGLWITVTLLPPCVAMGATVPLALAAIRADGRPSRRAFSDLYVANVLGAAAGPLASAFVLIELLGFRGTLIVAAVPGLVRVILGIGPFCAVTGFITPMLVDRWSGGNPGRAGLAYAVNVVGCIVGPLVASFVLLPEMGERDVELLLAVPLLGTTLLILAVPSLLGGLDAGRVRRRAAPVLALGALGAVVIFAATRGVDEIFPRREVRRDHTATVVATGEGMDKKMWVNGIAITSLTPITKMMAHLPLAARERPPRNGLVIALGMGTSFRSMLSWGIPTTAVELVPSVPDLIGYYHADGPDRLRSPLARLVIDDGRRFMERSSERWATSPRRGWRSACRRPRSRISSSGVRTPMPWRSSPRSCGTRFHSPRCWRWHPRPPRSATTGRSTSIS